MRKIALIGLFLSVPMLAGANVPSSKVTVSFADLDLNERHGQETLYRRLEVAVNKVCGPTYIRLVGSVSRLSENKQCFDETMEKTLNTLNIPALKEFRK